MKSRKDMKGLKTGKRGAAEVAVVGAEAGRGLAPGVLREAELSAALFSPVPSASHLDECEINPRNRRSGRADLSS